MAYVTVPAASHTGRLQHDSKVRDVLHRLSASIMEHMHGRADKLEQEAAELRRQAAVHTAELDKAGIMFIDLTHVDPVTMPSTITGAASQLASAPSVDGSHRFDVV